MKLNMYDDPSPTPFPFLSPFTFIMPILFGLQMIMKMTPHDD